MRFFNQVIKRPAATTAIAIAFVSLAAHALVGRETSVDPALGRPAVSITVGYRGASPAVVEREVVRPIERRIAGITGIVRTEASARDGMGRVAIYFDFASDLRRAYQAVHDSVAAVRRELPNQADEPAITQGDRGGPAAVALVSDAPGRTPTVEPVVLSLLQGAALALLVFLFLVRAWRSALVVALSVSATALLAATASNAMGIGLTPMMLLGLALGVGLAIDDVIVVRESIVRQTELGSDLPAAIARGTREMTGVLVVGALTTLAILVPLAHVGGTAGGLLAAGATPIIAAALLSLLLSVSFVPAVSRLLSSPISIARKSTARFAWLDWWFDGLTDRYHERLAWSLSNRATVAAIAVALLAGLVGLQLGAGTVDLLPTPTRAESDGTLGTSTARDVELTVRGPDARTLLGVAQHVADETRRAPGVVEVRVSTTARNDSEGPAQIDHLDGERVVRVYASLARRSNRDLNHELTVALAAMPLPPGYRVHQSGYIVERNDVFRRVLTALGAALVLVYVVLAVRWRSLVEPVTIIVAIPLTLSGVAAALLAVGITVSLPAIVGAAFAAAMTIRHAVPLLDAARGRRPQGLSIRVALIEASRRRFRAIVIGAAVMVAWLVPLVLVGGEAGDTAQALGVAAVAGALASVLVTLFLIPVLSATGNELAERVRAWKPSFRHASTTALPLEPGD